MTTVFKQLPDPLQKALHQAFEIEHPTDIQKDTLPPILEGKNVVLQSPTGSGKTLAYLLPLLARIHPEEAANQLLIVAPTQELSVQIANVIRAMNTHLAVPYQVAVLNGGANITHQIEKLKKKPAVLVGTPGRIVELFEKKKINGQTITAMVFDEVDALLEYDHGKIVHTIQKKCRRSTQLVAASASINMEAQQFLRKNIEEVVFLLANEEATLNPNISHFTIHCEARKKFDYLRHALAAIDGKTLIFLNGDQEITLLQERLAHHSIFAGALCANMKKLDRQHTLEAFRKGTTTILISSDLSARGLDIPDIDQIINMDFPHQPMTYVHRAGRTARGEAHGATLSFVSHADSAAIRIYKRDLGIDFTEVHFAEGQLVLGPSPKATKKATTKKAPKKNKNKGLPNRMKRKER